MLKIKLGKAFNFIPQTNINVPKAFELFLQGTDVSQLQLSEEMVQSLFNDWLLFDDTSSGETSLIAQYYLRNPDSLDTEELDELRQIIETQSLHLLQAHLPSKPPYVFLQSVFTGQKFKIYDQSLSQSADFLDGSFYGRVAKVGKIHHLVGSNPLVIPLRYTDRAIGIYVKEKTPTPTLKEVLQIFSVPKIQTKKPVFNKSERRKLEKKYNRIAKTYQVKMTFQKIAQFIYNEQYADHFADYFSDLMKLGIPEKMCFNHTDLFNDMWNFLPHKCLNDRSPDEVHRERQAGGE